MFTTLSTSTLLSGLFFQVFASAPFAVEGLAVFPQFLHAAFSIMNPNNFIPIIKVGQYRKDNVVNYLPIFMFVSIVHFVTHSFHFRLRVCSTFFHLMGIVAIGKSTVIVGMDFYQKKNMFKYCTVFENNVKSLI